MSEKDDDLIYEYNEEENQDRQENVDPDDSPRNFASYSFDDEDDNGEASGEISDKKRSPFSLMIEIMFNPIQGWKNLRRQKFTPERIQAGCFYPLLALLAVSKFADYFYSVKVSLSSIVTQAVIAFVSYFLGYFCIILILNAFLPKKVGENFDTDFGKDYIIIGLSTLSLFSFVTNLLPMLWPILIFLPLWTLYILYKGSRFFKLAETHVLRFLVIVCASVIGVPLIIDWGLNELLPY